MLEGGGKTPILSPMELEDIGFKIVAYPLSLVGVSIRAMQVFSLLYCWFLISLVRVYCVDTHGKFRFFEAFEQ